MFSHQYKVCFQAPARNALITNMGVDTQQKVEGPSPYYTASFFSLSLEVGPFKPTKGSG